MKLPQLIAQFVELPMLVLLICFGGPLILIGLIWTAVTVVEGWFSRKNLLGLAAYLVAIAAVTFLMIRVVFHV
jgi:hypothetical protein